MTILSHTDPSTTLTSSVLNWDVLEASAVSEGDAHIHRQSREGHVRDAEAWVEGRPPVARTKAPRRGDCRSCPSRPHNPNRSSSGAACVFPSNLLLTAARQSPGNPRFQRWKVLGWFLKNDLPDPPAPCRHPLESGL